MGSRRNLKTGAALLAAVLTAGLGVAEVQSRQQRRQPSRRVTNPVNPQTAPAPATQDEPRLVSTAEEQQQQDERETPRTARARRNRQQSEQQQGQAEDSRKALEQLSTEVTRLNRKVDDMEKQRRVDLVLERLARAETRAEAVQSQLRETMEKEANLQARLDQLEDLSRPESIERQTALVGSFRPDVERDRLRAQYENEKKRVRDLLDVNSKQRQRLETSLITADQFVERLRAQLDDETRREQEADAARGNDATAARPASTPSPTPTPPQK